jgi:hypothetical protein
MKMLKALIATAILGTSTLAVAEPLVRDHRDFGNSYYDDYRAPNTDRQSFQRFRQQRRGPIMLAQNLELDRRQPAYVALDGRVSQLRFDADDGRVFIDSVIVMFDDGRSQTLDIKRRLNDRSQPLTLDIQGRVSGVYIYGMSRRGSLDVVGIRSAYNR